MHAHTNSFIAEGIKSYLATPVWICKEGSKNKPRLQFPGTLQGLQFNCRQTAQIDCAKVRSGEWLTCHESVWGVSQVPCMLSHMRGYKDSLLSPLSPTCLHTSVNTSQGFKQKPMSLQQAVFVAGSVRNLKARFHESWHHLSDSKKESFFYALNSIRVQLSIQMRLYQLLSHAVLLGILVTLPAITNRAV